MNVTLCVHAASCSVVTERCSGSGMRGDAPTIRFQHLGCAPREGVSSRLRDRRLVKRVGTMNRNDGGRIKEYRRATVDGRSQYTVSLIARG